MKTKPPLTSPTNAKFEVWIYNAKKFAKKYKNLKTEVFFLHFYATQTSESCT